MTSLLKLSLWRNFGFSDATSVFFVSLWFDLPARYKNHRATENTEVAQRVQIQQSNTRPAFWFYRTGRILL